MRKQIGPALWKQQFPLDERFLAASGRVRLLEDQLMHEEDLRRLAEPETSLTQRREILAQAGYPERETLEDSILAGRDENDRLLKELCKGTILPTFLLLDLDYHNVKAILRFLLLRTHEVKESLTEHEEMATTEYTISADEIPGALQPLLRTCAPTDVTILYPYLVKRLQGSGKENHAFRPLFQEHLDTLIAASLTDRSYETLDMLADRLCFEESCSLAKSKEAGKMADFLQTYLGVQADGVNLSTFLRIRRMHAPKSLLEKGLVPGGYIAEKDFLDAFGQDDEALLALLHQSPIQTAFPQVPAYQTREDIWKFSYRKDLLLLQLAELGKRNTAGAPVLTAFWLKKKLEQKNIRIILQAVARGEATEEILTSLRLHSEEGRA